MHFQLVVSQLTYQHVLISAASNFYHKERSFLYSTINIYAYNGIQKAKYYKSCMTASIQHYFVW